MKIREDDTLDFPDPSTLPLRKLGDTGLMPQPPTNVRPRVAPDPMMTALQSRLDALNNPQPPSAMDRIATIARGIDWQPPAQHQAQEQARMGMEFQQKQAQRQALAQQIQSALQQQQQGVENARNAGVDARATEANARANTAADQDAAMFPTQQRLATAQATQAEQNLTKPDTGIANPGDIVFDKKDPSKPLLTNPPRPPTLSFQEQEYDDWSKKPANAGKNSRDDFDIAMAAAKRAPKDTTASDQARIERSFNARNSELEKDAKPISDSIQRLGRLNDTITNGSPIADSVTAPELMVVMAGGAGSGVRITTAEINNIMGGSSKWEQAKAALNQWNTNPAAANKILEPMRGQIKKLLDTVNSKLVQKEQVIEEARQKLIDTDDSKEHKQIVADTKKALAAIDSGTQKSSPGGNPGSAPSGGGIPLNPSTGKPYAVGDTFNGKKIISINSQGPVLGGP